MTREEFDAKRWKLRAWRKAGTGWTLGGFDVHQVNGRWKIVGPMGETYPGVVATEAEARLLCESIMIQDLLHAFYGALEEA